VVGWRNNFKDFSQTAASEICVIVIAIMDHALLPFDASEHSPPLPRYQSRL